MSAEIVSGSEAPGTKWTVQGLTTERRALIVCILAYLLLAVGTAVTRQPYGDEGELESPAFTLAHRGYMTVTQWELHRGSQKAYWMPPFFFLAQAAWQTLVGFGLIQMRLASVLWGLVLLLALRYILATLTRDRKFALLAVAFLGVDYTFLMHAGIGRCEIMSAALAVASGAAYLKLRQRSIPAALLGSHTLMACSGLTHPAGAMVWFPCLVALQFLRDRAAFRWRHLAFSALPYLIGGLAWGAYILQNPSEFRAQAQISLSMNRLSGFGQPLSALGREIGRFSGYYGVRPGAALLVRLKMLLPLGYLLGLTAALVVPSLRRDRVVKAALLVFLVHFLVLAVAEGTKQYQYVVYPVVPLVTMVAAVIWRGWHDRPKWRRFITALAVALMALQIGPTLFRIGENRYRKDFLPTVRAMRPYVEERISILSQAEFAVPFGFPDNIFWHPAYGYGRSKPPDVVVASRQAFEANRAGFRSLRPKIYHFMTVTFPAEYEAVFVRGDYVIYKRRPG